MLNEIVGGKEERKLGVAENLGGFIDRIAGQTARIVGHPRASQLFSQHE
jgi:hypothetical protein